MKISAALCLCLFSACGAELGSPGAMQPGPSASPSPSPGSGSGLGPATVVDNAPSACTPGTRCPNGTLCNTLDGEFGTCLDANPTPCTPSGDDCNPGEQCVEFPNQTTDCFSPPETPCTAHYWVMNVSSEGVGSHLDSCMNCKPDRPEGSECTEAITENGDLELDCDATVQLGAREFSGSTTDIMTLDYPMVNPAGLARCYLGWGVFPLVGIDQSTTRHGKIRIPGGAAHAEPMHVSGLTTRLPAAAFQHAFIEKPPVPSVAMPSKKEERAARIFWDDASMEGKRGAPLPASYQTCPDCETYDDLVEHLYPGEIFCQGLSRDPADSSFVVPFWLPHYDQPDCTAPTAIVSELYCEALDGTTRRSVGVFIMPPRFAPLPISYPDVCEAPPIE